MASIETVRVPDIGDFDEVDVVEVLIAPGDTISEGDSLITIESDKASLDVPSPFTGLVTAVLVAVNDKVGEGSPICTIEISEKKADDATREPEPLEDEIPAQPIPPAHAEEPAEPPAAQTKTDTEEPSSRLPEEGATQHPPPLVAKGLKSHASPSVRRFARELGADLEQVEPTGPKGRILKEDVQASVKRELAQLQPSAAGLLPAMPEVDFSKFGETEVEPLSKIRKLSARNVYRSWIHVPHVTQFDEADITDLEVFRKAHVEEATALGFKLSILPFLILASAKALKKFPRFNSSLDPSGENLILKKVINIGIAVDTPDGLVVPVLRDADKKGLFALAAELADMSDRARQGKSKLDEFQGATFSISSLGGIGGTAFTPIVNSPEVAILGVSRHRMKQIWNDREFVPRLMLPLSLSYDHRVIDGAAAARFITTLGYLLSDIRNLLL